MTARAVGLAPAALMGVAVAVVSAVAGLLPIPATTALPVRHRRRPIQLVRFPLRTEAARAVTAARAARASILRSGAVPTTCRTALHPAVFNLTKAADLRHLRRSRTARRPALARAAILRARARRRFEAAAGGSAVVDSATRAIGLRHAHRSQALNVNALLYSMTTLRLPGGTSATVKTLTSTRPFPNQVQASVRTTTRTTSAKTSRRNTRKTISSTRYHQNSCSLSLTQPMT